MTNPQELNDAEYEEVFETIYDISKTSSFEVKTTEAMHYRCFLTQKMKENRGESASKAVFRTAGVSGGQGLVFVSHTGDIYPSGFLPVYGGNVRRHSLVDVDRNSGLFPVLRDTTAREGKCGICEYH